MDEVRREGDWCLLEVEPGVFEVVHGDRTVCKLVTADYAPAGLVDAREDISVPVEEVETRDDAAAAFDERAAEPPPEVDAAGAPAPVGDLEEFDAVLADLPMGLVLVVGLVGGTLALVASGFALLSPIFLVGVGLLALAGLVAVVAAALLVAEGTEEAVALLRW